MRVKTALKSAPFQVRAKSEPLLQSLQLHIRFFNNPLSAYSTIDLAVSLPNGRIYGLTKFHFNDNDDLGSIYLPATLISAYSQM